MTTIPLLFRYEGDGEFQPATPYWGQRADKSYVVGEVYRLVTHEERSQASHNHYFASLQNGYDNLSDAMRDQFPTVEHLRKKLLIRAGYADERSIVCASKAEAQRMAAFIRPMDEYAQEVHDLRARLASCEAEREKAIELIDEGLGILVSLIDNVTRHGNYSPESTCTFIDQAGGSFRDARAALTKGGEDAE